MKPSIEDGFWNFIYPKEKNKTHNAVVTVEEHRGHLYRYIFIWLIPLIFEKLCLGDIIFFMYFFIFIEKGQFAPSGFFF